MGLCVYHWDQICSLIVFPTYRGIGKQGYQCQGMFPIFCFKKLSHHNSQTHCIIFHPLFFHLDIFKILNQNMHVGIGCNIIYLQIYDNFFFLLYYHMISIVYVYFFYN